MADHSTLLICIVSASLVSAANSFFDPYPDKAKYPFVLHRPLVPDGDKWPVVLFLHGSGSRGDVSSLTENTKWDGVGWMISQHYGGKKTKTTSLVVDKFLAIMPLQPLSKTDWDEEGVLDVFRVAQTLPNVTIDLSRVTLGGYSMCFQTQVRIPRLADILGRGARGSWRIAFKSPETFNAVLPSAGDHGFSDDQLQSLLAVDPPPAFYVMAGSKDDKTHSPDLIKADVERLQKLADDNADDFVFQEIDGDHSLMGHDLWLQDALWDFVLAHSRGGVEETPPSQGSKTRTRTVTATGQGAATPLVLANDSASMTGTFSLQERLLVLVAIFILALSTFLIIWRLKVKRTAAAHVEQHPQPACDTDSSASSESDSDSNSSDDEKSKRRLVRR